MKRIIIQGLALCGVVGQCVYSMRTQAVRKPAGPTHTKQEFQQSASPTHIEDTYMQEIAQHEGRENRAIQKRNR